MAEYNPSKIIKDGNTYNFRDTTKIPLAGSNQISGSLVPSTDGTVNLGGPSYQWNQAYIKSLTINGVACGDILTHNVSEFVNVTGAQTIGGVKTFSSNVIIQGSKKVTCNLDNSFIELDGGTTWGKGGSIVLSGQDRSSYTNSVLIVSKSDTNTDILQYQNGELKPLSNNTNNPSLGTPTNKWSKVYSDDVVHTTDNETIGGEKTFSNLRTYFGRDISCYATIKYGNHLNPTSNSYQYLNFSGNTVSDGPMNDWTGGYLEQVVDTNGGSRGRWHVQDTSGNFAGVEIWASGTDKQFRPRQNGNTILGESARRWKDCYTNAINGINPGALSLPSTLLSAMIQIDTTSWVLDGETDVEYTPSGNGYLTLVNNQNLEWVKGQIPNDNNYGIYRFTYKYDSDLGGVQGVTIPCIKGKKVIMKIKGTGFYNALFTYCQGNV